MWWGARWPQPLWGRIGYQWGGHTGKVVPTGRVHPDTAVSAGCRARCGWRGVWICFLCGCSPCQNLLLGVAVFTELRTLYFLGSFWTCWLSMGVEGVNSCSGGYFLSFAMTNYTSPGAGSWRGTGKGGLCWVGDVTHTSPTFLLKQRPCCL